MMVLACIPDQDGNQDALPTVLLEALALDLPIVSTSLSGIPEIVADDVGILVPPGDPEALAAGIATLYDRIRHGRVRPGAARARARELFSLEKSVATLKRRFAESSVDGEKKR